LKESDTVIIWLLLAAFIAFLAIYTILQAKYKSSKTLKHSSHNSEAYKKRPFLLTKNELAFYNALIPAANGKNLAIFVKVRLADLIEPSSKSNFQSSFNRIKAKHIDFVLCDKPYIRPVLAIELDDASHHRDDRKKRDIFVDKALQSAGIPILHTLSSADISLKIDQLRSK
jgi:hypothetical protein